MKFTTNSRSAIWYDSGKLKYSNLGDLHLIPGFQGLVSNGLNRNLILPRFPTFNPISISSSSANKSKEIGESILSRLTSDFDYTESLDENGELRSLTLKQGLLRNIVVLDDMLLTKFDLFTQLNPIPASNINVDREISYPWRGNLGTPEFNTSIPKQYNFYPGVDPIIYVQLNELRYLAKYSRFNFNGEYLGSSRLIGNCTDRFIEVPKSTSELRFLTHIIFIYGTEN